jgi:membrane protein YqaA with SNARE-associated domain
MSPKLRVNLLRIAALLVVIGLSVFIYSIRDEAQKLAIYGYPGIFLLAFLSYATVILPAPGIAIVFTIGSFLNPVGVALAAGAGAALGELSGYLAGFGGQVVIKKGRLYDRLTIWMNTNGKLTVLLLAMIPNPLFDLAGVTAGALKMRLSTFLFWVWIGETIKMLFFAFLGSRFINFINELQ